jgi:hypothetical protein
MHAAAPPKEDQMLRMRCTPPATLALQPRLQSRDEMNASLGGGQIIGAWRPPTRLPPSCRYRAVGRSRVHRWPRCRLRSSPLASLASTWMPSPATPTALIYYCLRYRDLPDISRSARRPPCHQACARSFPRTPAASAVHVLAAASSRQGSEDSCGWAILSHGEDEPHIARGVLYTLKRPMHEPI